MNKRTKLVTTSSVVELTTTASYNVNNLTIKFRRHMKSWQRHFILGILIGIITIIVMRVILNSVPGYEEDSNLLITVAAIFSYGAGTAVLGEILMAIDSTKK